MMPRVLLPVFLSLFLMTFWIQVLCSPLWLTLAEQLGFVSFRDAAARSLAHEIAYAVWVGWSIPQMIAAWGAQTQLSLREVLHLGDVAALVKYVHLVTITSAIGLAFLWVRIRGNRHEVIQSLERTAAVIFALFGAGVLLVLIFGFSDIWYLAHLPFFAEGSFVFAPGSRITSLFPEQFWRKSALAWAGLTMASAFCLFVWGVLSRKRQKTDGTRKSDNAV